MFAVCIFLIAEDGQKILVDHRASDNLVDCLKKKRIAERDFRDPATRKKFTFSNQTAVSYTHLTLPTICSV